METNLEFDHARIAVKDVLVFVPSLEGPLKGNQQASLQSEWKTDRTFKGSAHSVSGNRRCGKY